MANDRLSHADFASRRRRAGASRETMAASLGPRPEDIQEIEERRASEVMVNECGQWLDRIESCPAEKRAQELLAAIDAWAEKEQLARSETVRQLIEAGLAAKRRAR